MVAETRTERKNDFEELLYWLNNQPDQGCRYHDKCSTCPYPKCKEDCRRLEHFTAPMLHDCIRLCIKAYPNIRLLQDIFQVSERTVYRALESDTAGIK